MEVVRLTGQSTVFVDPQLVHADAPVVPLHLEVEGVVDHHPVNCSFLTDRVTADHPELLSNAGLLL